MRVCARKEREKKTKQTLFFKGEGEGEAFDQREGRNQS